jgi:predicted permease
VILLIACTNLANMIVVHGITRHREIAIRLAVGGSRWCIVRQLFIESLLLALLGGGLGIVLAIWCMRVLNAWVAALALQFPLELARVLTTGLDLRVLAATLGFCLTATVLFGLKPAWRLSRRDVVADLKESAGAGFRSTRSTRGIMPRGLSVIFQTALSVVLVMAAILCTRSARKAVQTNPGFNLEGKLLIDVDTRAAGYDPARSVQVCEAVAEHLNSLPGVQIAGLSCDGGFGGSVVEYVPGVESDTSGNLLAKDPFVYPVGANYFESVGIPLLQGRAFRRLDSVPDAEKVLIIDEPLARRLRPDGNALGCLIQYGWRSLSEPHRIVGIVPTLHSALHNPEKRYHIYEPIGPKHRPAYIHLRLASNALGTEATLLRMIPAEIRKVDPHLPVLSVRTLMDCHRNNPEVWLRLMGARLSLIFGAMALFLAALGIYAVKGYMVASRTPEFGVRMALGATRRRVMTMVLREGGILTLVGLCWGLLLAWAVARLAGNLLYGVSPVDPVSIAITIVLLGAASLLAGYIPARRAAKVDPMVALRHE